MGRAGLVVATCVLTGLGAAQVKVRAAAAGASGADVTMVGSAQDLVQRVLAVEGEEALVDVEADEAAGGEDDETFLEEEEEEGGDVSNIIGGPAGEGDEEP